MDLGREVSAVHVNGFFFSIPAILPKERIQNSFDAVPGYTVLDRKVWPALSELF